MVCWGTGEKEGTPGEDFVYTVQLLAMNYQGQHSCSRKERWWTMRGKCGSSPRGSWRENSRGAVADKLELGRRSHRFHPPHVG